jgi:glyoxylase-like metal-dependent hydrolase (beta-lactamase superfamily II)
MAEAPQVIVIDGGMVNAYLLKTGERFVLVDTLTPGKRRLLDGALADAGCSAGSLALIVATHGDSDHVGNCAHVRERFGAPIGMHRAEAPVAETGDMRAGRPHMGGLSKAIFALLGPLFGLRKQDRFTPDIYFEDGDSLAEYGLDATVLHQPGHSEGSISVLTAQGDLFCGDLMTNRARPEANSLVDSPEKLAASVERVRTLGVRTVYPGHGKPFAMGELL